MKRAFTLIELLACQPKPWRRQVKSAFTLIELLVVIAIIGILASVVVVNVGSGRVKARDAKRISDLKAVQTALEMYYDQNGKYPEDTDPTDGMVSRHFSVWDSRTDDSSDNWVSNIPGVDW